MPELEVTGAMTLAILVANEGPTAPAPAVHFYVGRSSSPGSSNPTPAAAAVWASSSSCE